MPSRYGGGAIKTVEENFWCLFLNPNSLVAITRDCKDRSLYKCFKYLLTKLSNSIDVFVIFKWSLTLAIFDTIVETTQAIL